MILTAIDRFALYGLAVICLFAAGSSLDAGVIFGAQGLNGGFRWDAAPRSIGGRERSLDGGLRYSLSGGSFEAFRDQFSWATVPTIGDFQQAISDAFGAWEAVDPDTGLTTDLSFVPDLDTAVVGSGFSQIDIRGAEIDVIAADAGDGSTRGWTRFNAIGADVTLTSGPFNYPGSGAISGADITLNNNSRARYTLPFFRRLLTHEIGHAIGLGDVEGDINPNRFIDDNYDGSTSATALFTLTNSWADLVTPMNPAASPLGVYNVPASNPGIRTQGVDILMESRGLGIAQSNPTEELFPLRADDYGTRQFLYPSLVRIPEPVGLMLAGIALLGNLPRRL